MRGIGIRPGLIRLRRMLLSPDARPLRIVIASVFTALLQIGLFVALMATGMKSLPADIIAFLLGAQAGFVLGERFVWHDRPRARGARPAWRRWPAFQTTIAGPFALNELVFVMGRLVLPPTLLGVSGICIAAAVSFIIQDALTFG